MNRVLVDDSLRSKLDEFRDETELCDKNGKVLGVFRPATDPNRKWYEWAKSRHTEQDEKELERIAQEKPEGRTLQEILKSLRDS
jgi:hypothetical protein